MAPTRTFNHTLFDGWRAKPPQLWPTKVSAACAALERPETFGTVRLSGRIPPDGARDLTAKSDFLSDPVFQDQVRVAPTFDPMTLQFVDQVIDSERLGRGPATDLLAISLSSTDYIGHRYGNGGPEMCVQMEALDRALGAFLMRLDKLRIPYVVVLTADHGASDAAERAVRHGVTAERIDVAGLLKALNTELRQRFALQRDPIAAEDPQQLSIGIADPALRARISEAAMAWLKARPEVAEVFTADQIAGAAPPAGKPPADLTLAERFNESFDRERSGDIQVAFRRNASLGEPRSPRDAVAGHGTPWDYDRRVPILFWWRGIHREVRAEAAETVDIAPTLAAIIQVPTPHVDGRCLPSVAGSCHFARGPTFKLKGSEGHQQRTG